MRVTVDIDEKELGKVIKETGVKKISPAVNAALREFLALRERKRIIKRFLEGKADYSLTNEELEARDIHEAR
jgi:Arc/MetJ family transcription regulator